MSVHALSWAFKQDIRPSARKFILVALANYADEEGVCYPSQKTLASATGQSERSVREHLAGLEEDGIIVRVQRRRENGTWRSDCFQIVQVDSQPDFFPDNGEQTKNQRQISPSADFAAGEHSKPRKSAKSRQRQNSPAANSADGENFRYQRQISPSPAADFAAHIEEPSLEPSEEPKGIRPKRVRTLYPSDFDAFWSDYPTDPLMSKQDAHKAWARLSPEDRVLAHKAVPAFKAFCLKDPTYRPVHCCRFLSQRRFDGFLDASKAHYEPASKPADRKQEYADAYERARARSIAKSEGRTIQ